MPIGPIHIPRHSACPRLRLLWLAGLFFWLTACMPGYAESERAISGVVYDSATGVPIQDAIVRVAGTAFSAHTNAAGIFVISAVPAGSWNLQVTRYGYHPSAGWPVDVVEGFERHVRIDLTPNPILLSPTVVEHSRETNAAPNGTRTYYIRQIQEAGHRTIGRHSRRFPASASMGIPSHPVERAFLSVAHRRSGSLFC